MLLLLLHGHGCRALRLVVGRRQAPVASVHAHVSAPAVHHHPVLVLLVTGAPHAMHRLPLELLLLLLLLHVVHVGHAVAVEVRGSAWVAATRTHSAGTTCPHAAHHAHTSGRSTAASPSSGAHSVRQATHSTGHRVLSLPARARTHGSWRHLVLLRRLLLLLWVRVVAVR